MSSLAQIVKAYDVRGTVPDQLGVDVAWALGAAMAQVLAIQDGHSDVVIGHDMRPSSPELVKACAEGAAAAGVNVILIGLCSTDGLYYASGAKDLPGAMFTASHNPANYNGIKFTRSGARPVGEASGLFEIRDLAQSILDEGVSGFPGVATGTISEQDMLADYAGFLRGLVDLSGSRPLRVIVDAGNGMAGLTVPAVLGTEAGLPELPLSIEPLYFELDGTFPNHEANPLDPKNIVDLQAAVRASKADLGLAFDGDADRCFVVDEKGDPVTPSAITALIAEREIARERASDPKAQVSIVHNVITSAALPEIVTELGATPVRTRVGHSFVKADMAKENAIFGGEHSAHYYFRDFFFADTGMLAAMHVLAALGESDQPLSSVMAPYDRYPASGEINSRVSDAAATASTVREWAAAQEGVTVDELDGLTVTHAATEAEPMWWFNVRPSNTEPLLRLNVEAGDEATMARIRDEVVGIITGGAA